MIRSVDIAWAAGFLEGEGSFLAQTPSNPRVSCPQKEREPLERLELLFGGNIRFRQAAYAHNGSISQRPIFVWTILGQPAISLMMTIYPLMSSKRQGSMALVIRGWREWKHRAGPNKQWCRKGLHEWPASAFKPRQSESKLYCQPCWDANRPARRETLNKWLRKQRVPTTQGQLL